MAWVAEDADIGRHALAGERDILEIMPLGGCQFAGRRLACADPRGEVAFEPEPVVPAAIPTPPDQLGRAVEAIGEQDHAGGGGQPTAYRVEQMLLCGKSDGSVGLLDAPGDRQGALAPAHAQHQHLMAVGNLALVEDQRHGRIGLGKTRQDLAGERLHDRVAGHQIVGQEARDPLVAHIPAIRPAWQPRCEFHQIGAANMQHGGDQKRQLVTLRLALPRQPLLQFGVDPLRPNGDPACPHHLPIPLQKRGGILESHTNSSRQQQTPGN